eukprot:1832820-Amphidinium_carterae.1
MRGLYVRVIMKYRRAEPLAPYGSISFESCVQQSMSFANTTGVPPPNFTEAFKNCRSPSAHNVMY